MKAMAEAHVSLAWIDDYKSRSACLPR